jgi:hypothetical protein
MIGHSTETLNCWNAEGERQRASRAGAYGFCFVKGDLLN